MVNLRSRIIPDKPEELGTPRRRRASSVQPEAAGTADQKFDKQEDENASRRRRASSVQAESPRPRTRRFSGRPEEDDALSTPRSQRKSLRSNTPDLSKTIKSNLFDGEPDEVKTRPAPIEEEDESPQKRGVRKSKKESDTKERELKTKSAISPVLSKNVGMDSSFGGSEKTERCRRGSLVKAKEMKITDYFDSSKVDIESKAASPVMCLKDLYASNLKEIDSEGKKRHTSPIKERRGSGKGITEEIMEVIKGGKSSDSSIKGKSPSICRGSKILDMADTESKGDSSPSQSVESHRKSSKYKSDQISEVQGKMDKISPRRSQGKSPSPDKMSLKRLARKSDSCNEDTRSLGDSSPRPIRSPRKSLKSGSDLITVSTEDHGNKDEISPSRRQVQIPSPDRKPIVRSPRKSVSDPISVSSSHKGNKDKKSPSGRREKSPSPDKKYLERLSRKSDSPNEDIKTISDQPSRSSPKDPPSVRSPRKSAKPGSGQISVSLDEPVEKAEGLSPTYRQEKSPFPDKILPKRLSRKSESSNEGTKTMNESSPSRAISKTDSASITSPRKRAKSGSGPISISSYGQEGMAEGSSTCLKEMIPLPKQRPAKRNSKNSKSEGGLVSEVEEEVTEHTSTVGEQESRRGSNSRSESVIGLFMEDLTSSPKKDKGMSARVSMTSISIDDSAAGFTHSPRKPEDVQLSAADETSKMEKLSPVAISPIKTPSNMSLRKRSDWKVSDAALSDDSTTICPSSRGSEGNGESSNIDFKSEQLSYQIRDTESSQKRKSLQHKGRKMSLENTEDSINPKDVDSLLAPKNDGGMDSSIKPSEPTARLPNESISESISQPVSLNKAMAMDWEPTNTPDTKIDGITEMKYADRDESWSETPRISKNAKRRKSGSQQTPVSEFQVSRLQADIDSPSVLTKSSPLHGKTMTMEVTDGVKKTHIRGKKKKSRRRNKSGSEQLVSSLNEVSSPLVPTKDDISQENNKEADSEERQVMPKGMSDDVKNHNAPSKKKKKRRRRNKSGSDLLPTSAGCQVSSFVEKESSSRVLSKEDLLPEDNVRADGEKELLISDTFSGDTKSLNVSGKKRKEPKRSSESDSENNLSDRSMAHSEAASSGSSTEDHEENGLVDERTEETSEKEKKLPTLVEEIRLKDNTWKMGDSEVTVRRRGGGTIIGSRPVFSDDAKYVYVNCGWGVRVFSIETGECVKVFDAFSKDHKVVACFCWKSCPAALTSEGVFIAWDPRSGRVQQKVRLNVRDLIVDGFFFSVGSETILCLALETKRSTWLQVYSGTTFRSQPQHPLNNRKIGHPYNLHHLSVGCNPERPLIAFISKGNKTCKIINIGNKVVGSGVFPGPGKDWTCVQCHPSEDTVALGDSIGRIVVYRIGRAGDKSKMQLLPSVYHWHTLPVSEIAFTSAGSSMYSGGGELTLVKWNLENPHIKNYLPRLSADIVHIAVSPYNQMIAIATLDNGIQIVTPNNKLHCVLQQLSWSVFVGEKEGMFPAGLIYDPRSRGLMLNGRPGHLQLYSPLSETLTYNIDVTMMNYLTQERDKVIVNTQVTHSALTSDGLWLATIETRYEPGLALELKLKFWEYNVDKKRYVLATVIDMPHDGKVHSIKFSPGYTGPVSNEDVDADHEVILASTGADKKLRLWSKTPIDSIYHKGSTWRCQNACFYRDRSSGPCSFSYDGSLLAVGFNSVLTLWDVENVILKQTITQGTEELKFIEFGRDDCCHILMCATDTNIVAWNLLTLSLVWKVDTRTALFVPDPYSCFFAIFTVENQWKILDAHNGEVVFTMNSDGKSEVGYHSSKSQVLAAVFAPRHRPNPDAPQWMKNSYLYYIDIYQELNCLEPANEISQLPIFQLAFDKDAGTPFGSLVGAKSVREATDEEHSKQVVGYGVLGSQAVTQLLRPPAHTLPPVSLLCGSFLQSFVIMKRDAPHAESDHEDKSEDDKTTVVASSDSEDDTRISSTSKKSASFKKSAKPKEASKSEKSPKARRRKQNKQQKTLSTDKKELDEPMETETIDLRKHFPPLDDDDAAESMFVIDD